MTGYKNDHQLQADRVRLAATPGRPCAAGTDDAWFEVGGSADPIAQDVARAEARQLCAGCPVADLCLDVAIRGAEAYGVWGGITEHDRRPLIRAHRRQKPIALVDPATVEARRAQVAAAARRRRAIRAGQLVPEARSCLWCQGPIPADTHPNVQLCSAVCREARKRDQDNRAYQARRQGAA